MRANDSLDSSIALLEEEKHSLKSTHSDSEIVADIVKNKGKRITRITGVISNTKTQIIC